MFVPRLKLYSAPDLRESKIQEYIAKLQLTYEEEQAFRAIAYHLDAFRWAGEMVVLREIKKAARPQLIYSSSSASTTRQKGEL